MSLTPPAWYAAQASFPRVSGDEPTMPLGALIVDRFSPRERG